MALGKVDLSSTTILKKIITNYKYCCILAILLKPSPVSITSVFLWKATTIFVVFLCNLMASLLSREPDGFDIVNSLNLSHF